MPSISEMLRSARRHAARKAARALVERARERAREGVEGLRGAIRAEAEPGPEAVPEVDSGVELRRRVRAARAAAAELDVQRLRDEAHEESRHLYPAEPTDPADRG